MPPSHENSENTPRRIASAGISPLRIFYVLFTDLVLIFKRSLGIMKISEILGEPGQRTRRQFIAESLAGCWVISLLGFSGFVLHFNSAPIGFLFLLVVVTEAILCGFWQATIVSLLACACLDYLFYPPILVFSISDPQDWVALGAFE